MKPPAPSYSCGRRWVEHVEHYYRDQKGGYFYAADDVDTLIARVKIAEDSALPSGNGMMLQVLAQLYYLTGESVYRQRAEAIAEDFAGTIRQRVLGFSSLLNGMDMLREGTQIVVIGERDAADTAALKRAVYGVSRPGRVFNVIAPAARCRRAHPAFGKTLLGDRATAYVCREWSACQSSDPMRSRRLCADLTITRRAPPIRAPYARQPGLFARRAAGCNSAGSMKPAADPNARQLSGRETRHQRSLLHPS
jgi:uncharacterized protein YyaL (SSP411 family)